ncbi:MAG TPA: hypothetical protein VGP33_05830 [Chloroflexota bacterium]|nr:hypothetical protein [Chloroflexota bacterium]
MLATCELVAADVVAAALDELVAAVLATLAALVEPVVAALALAATLAVVAALVLAATVAVIEALALVAVTAALDVAAGAAALEEPDVVVAVWPQAVSTLRPATPRTRVAVVSRKRRLRRCVPKSFAIYLAFLQNMLSSRSHKVCQRTAIFAPVITERPWAVKKRRCAVQPATSLNVLVAALLQFMAGTGSAAVYVGPRTSGSPLGAGDT